VQQPIIIVGGGHGGSQVAFNYLGRFDAPSDRDWGAATEADLLGGGALGRTKLANLGAPTGWFFLALLAELALGAVVMALIDAWRLRR
jgi:hypothetical protein